MNALNSQWIELIRAGNYGDQGSFSVADLDKIVANYDPAKHEAPVTMGQPKHDDPAYGWIEAVRRAGNALLGKITQMPEQFARLLSEGKLKKRSISFYRGDNGPSLRHVSFLETAANITRGLENAKVASFSGDGNKTVARIDITEKSSVQFSEPGRGSRVDMQSVNLAERAMVIFREQKIPYGQALTAARREMADIVGSNNGSPLRDQGTASTPPSSEVRTAVVAGLNAVASTWKNGDSEWIATSGATALYNACASVGDKLHELGIGYQLISGMKEDLFAYLNRQVLGLIYGGTLSGLISQTADHVASTYEQALANKVATQQYSEGQIELARQVVQGTGSYVSMDDVALRDNAMAVCKDRGVSFGEALRIVRHSFASDVVKPEELSSVISAALREKFGSMLQGKEKVLSSSDCEQALKAAMDAVKKLNISGWNQVWDAVKKSLSTLVQGSAEQAAVKPGDVEAIAAKASTSAALAYSKHLSSVS